MKKIFVKDMMVPLAEYATVHKDASYQDAILSLERCWKQYDKSPFKHRAILVLDDAGEVVGKLSQLDMIRALEPKYTKIANFGQLTHFGLNVDFLRDMVRKEELWTDPLESLCQMTTHMKVSDVMHIPVEDEKMDEGATLADAMHHLLMGRYQSLLVTRNGKVVGILRLTDVFDKVCSLIKSCAAQKAQKP